MSLAFTPSPGSSLPWERGSSMQPNEPEWRCEGLGREGGGESETGERRDEG